MRAFFDSFFFSSSDSVFLLGGSSARLCVCLFRLKCILSLIQWDKFRNQILRYIISFNQELGKQLESELESTTALKTLPGEFARPHLQGARVLVMIGLPACGKSTFANKLLTFDQGHRDIYVRVSQDEMGSRWACQKTARSALSCDKSVLVDRCNFDPSQRKPWFQEAKRFKADSIEAVYFDVPVEVCVERVMKRKSHETLPPTENAPNVVRRFADLMVPPTEQEPFDAVHIIRSEEDIDQLIPVLAEPPTSVHPLSGLPAKEYQDFWGRVKSTDPLSPMVVERVAQSEAQHRSEQEQRSRGESGPNRGEKSSVSPRRNRSPARASGQPANAGSSSSGSGSGVRAGAMGSPEEEDADGWRTAK